MERQARINAEDIPRCTKMDGTTLRILSASRLALVITDGERTAVYSAYPGCPQLDSAQARIVPKYTEAGWFCEANILTVTDGLRTVTYEPVVAVPADAPHREVPFYLTRF